MAGTGREFIPTFERITRERGNHPALVLLQNFEPGIAPDKRGPSLTYTELGTRARRMAAGLTANGMRGERVLLLHPTGFEFTVAMLACIYSGAIAVPAPPPTAFGRGVARLAGIVEDAGVACVVADTTISDPVRTWLADSGLGHRLRCLTEPGLDGGDGPARPATSRTQGVPRSCSTPPDRPASPRAWW